MYMRMTLNQLLVELDGFKVWPQRECVGGGWGEDEGRKATALG
jgi:hypothetical protein